MLQPLQNEMNVPLTVSSLSTVEYCNTAILNIEVMTNIRGFFKTFNANIKQPCWEKVPDVPEPFFHMRGLGQQDVLKLLCNLVSIGIPDKTFSFSPEVLFLKLWIIIEDAKSKINISRKSWSYYFWIMECLSIGKIGNNWISSKTSFISELIRESRKSGNIMKISKSFPEKTFGKCGDK